MFIMIEYDYENREKLAKTPSRKMTCFVGHIPEDKYPLVSKAPLYPRTDKPTLMSPLVSRVFFCAGSKIM